MSNNENIVDSEILSNDSKRIHEKNNEPRGKPMFPDREAADEFVYS